MQPESETRGYIEPRFYPGACLVKRRSRVSTPASALMYTIAVTSRPASFVLPGASDLFVASCSRSRLQASSRAHEPNILSARAPTLPASVSVRGIGLDGSPLTSQQSRALGNGAVSIAGLSIDP
ncbi:hypothetical protein SEVIR_3G210301v4 [Setaria viridis]